MKWIQLKQYVKYSFCSFVVSVSLILSQMLSIGSLASTTSGTETTTYNYTTIYPNNQLNQNVIDKFNNMTLEEKEQLLPFLSPIFLKSLGIYTSDAYTRINDLYNQSLASFKSLYPTAQELQDSDESYAIKKAYTYLSRGHGYYYYDSFLDYLANNIQETGGQLVLSDTETIYNVYDDVIHNEQIENGQINVELLSYKNINSSSFKNLSVYSRFIGLCKQYKDCKYVCVLRWNNGPYQTVTRIMFPINGNLYNNGATVGNTLNFCNDNGQELHNFYTYYARNEETDFTYQGDYFYTTNGHVGSSNISIGYADNISNGNYYTASYAVYTLNEDRTNYILFNSLNGWVNNQGHYEPSYQIGTNYGTVPSAVVSSNDMTTYYNNTYIDNSQGSHNTVWYPPNYDPTDNGYDSETHTLKFDGVGSFISSLGNLIGSLINGIAEGIANIINSLITVVNNLKLNLLQGPIFDLLKAFMSWLPDEIVALLTAVFSITVIFALIKLIKGFF